MKKLILIGIILLLAGGSLFAQNDYSDFKNVLRDVMEVMDIFAEDLTNAENADEVVAAIETYHESIQPLEPKMEAMDEKYSDIDDTNYPVELAEVMEDYAETMEKFGEAMAVLMEYINNEKVLEAMDKLE